MTLKQLVRERNILIRLINAEELAENHKEVNNLREELNDIEALIALFDNKSKSNE